MTNMPYPGAGTGVYIRRDGKVLLGKRKGSQPGTWCPPGGKLDMYEELEACARREVREETGLEVENVKYVSFSNDLSPEDRTHYITFSFVADWAGGEAHLVEPEKFATWEWFAWDVLPAPLFLSTRKFVESGYNPLNL